jgi:hypothetical protein
LRSRAFGQALKGCVEFRKKFRKSFENVWKKFEKSLKKAWKKFEKSLKKVWKKFEKSLKKVWRRVRTGRAAIQSPRFGKRGVSPKSELKD